MQRGLHLCFIDSPKAFYNTLQIHTNAYLYRLYTDSELHWYTMLSGKLIQTVMIEEKNENLANSTFKTMVKLKCLSRVNIRYYYHYCYYWYYCSVFLELELLIFQYAFIERQSIVLTHSSF